MTLQRRFRTLAAAAVTAALLVLGAGCSSALDQEPNQPTEGASSNDGTGGKADDFGENTALGFETLDTATLENARQLAHRGNRALVATDDCEADAACVRQYVFQNGDLAAREGAAELAVDGSIRDLALGRSDAKNIAVGTNEGVELYDAATGESVGSVDVGGSVESLFAVAVGFLAVGPDIGIQLVQTDDDAPRVARRLTTSTIEAPRRYDDQKVGYAPTLVDYDSGSNGGFFAATEAGALLRLPQQLDGVDAGWHGVSFAATIHDLAVRQGVALVAAGADGLQLISNTPSPELESSLRQTTSELQPGEVADGYRLLEARGSEAAKVLDAAWLGGEYVLFAEQSTGLAFAKIGSASTIWRGTPWEADVELDVVGGHSRPDIRSFSVDRDARRIFTLHDDGLDVVTWTTGN